MVFYVNYSWASNLVASSTTLNSIKAESYEPFSLSDLNSIVYH